MAGLELKHIDKIYPNTETKKKKRKKGEPAAVEPAQKELKAVSDFNLEIKDKEFLVLVGPSGCGKSTTLRMIAGLEDITAGELYIDGQLVNNVASKDRDIAMVFQSYALYPHMTVFENMAFALKLRKVPKDEIKTRVLEAAKILELEEYLGRKPKALSGGQRQRVALGRAIVRQPKVFLMDEPLSNLDAKLRVAMRTEIAKLHKRLATTFIYVTHDQTEAMTMGDRIVVMKDGVIQQVGDPNELYQQPANRFVAEFIGSPQMNVFPAAIERTANETFALIGGKKITVNAERAAKIDLPEGKSEVFIGIRPEDLYVEEENLVKYPDSQIDANIEVREPLGSDIYLYMTVPGVDKTVTARVLPTYDGKMDETVKLALDTERMHVFDCESGASLIRG